ncbi:hypothetical protein ZWY2020_006390 [Hordeum vulgare]|nr:hypothetical protein ZWY2020_006390 [Hordeum vulgare]
MNDLRRIKQQEGETLHKFIQHFTVMRLKIPKASDEAIISSFSDGVTDLEMKEELTMSDKMSTTLEMLNLANKCSRAEEGRLSLLGPQAAEPEEKKAKAKEVKRKAPAMLAAKPEAKYGRGGERPSGGAPMCIFHGTNGHHTSEYQELRLARAEHFSRCPGRGDRSPACVGTTESRVRGALSSLIKTVGMASLRRTAGAAKLKRTAGATTLRRGNDAVSLVRSALVRLDCLLCVCHPRGGDKDMPDHGAGGFQEVDTSPTYL